MKKTYQDVVIEADLSEAMAEARIDKEKGMLHNVVLLTGEQKTKNNTFYTKKALTEAVSRYEGAKMFLDHGDSEVRSVRDLGGVYSNVKMKENKIVGDLKLVNDPKVREIAYLMAEEKVGGLSIRDRGRGYEQNDVFMVEGFSKGSPYSIDLVSEPSANKNFFESAEGNEADSDETNKGGDDMKLSDAKIEDLQKENPALVESIRADERKAVLKEVEEGIKKGENADKVLAQAKKLTVLSEAAFNAEVFKSVKKMIEPEAITLEVAEGIIAAQKEVIKSVSKSKTSGDPLVEGHGVDREIAEADLGTKGQVSDEQLVEALTK